MRGRLIRGLSVALLLACACGPIEYVNQVTRKASADVAAAKAVRADKYAPYFYTLAVEFLHKAREEAAHADYQAANRFGRESSNAAKEARKLSIQRAGDPEWEDQTPEKIRGDGSGAGDKPVAPLDEGDAE
jgi:hypothetical protein